MAVDIIRVQKVPDRRLIITQKTQTQASGCKHFESVRQGNGAQIGWWKIPVTAGGLKKNDCMVVRILIPTQKL